MKGFLPLFFTALAVAALIILSALLGVFVDDLVASVAIEFALPAIGGFLLLAWLLGGRGAGATSIKVDKSGLTLLAEILGVASFVITVVALVAKN